ncbi:neogenin-like isoform X3 [Gigantopelta aegis]|uniref:neogenin-like isoform X3 n=1 Tax=Gigantopelta aegis TaxID=1735272 RepID=UPI001B889B0A|nr:neogenin-like isoform X3 [Gigantopelta aegis]
MAAAEDEKLTRRAALRVGIVYFCLALVVEATTVPHFSQFFFTVEPRDVVVKKGAKTLLNCSAYHGDMSPAIRWIKDGQNLNLANTNRRTLLENGSLFFEEVLHSKSNTDRGLYQCEASVSGLGTIISRKARIDIAHIAKHFDAEPIAQIVYLHDTAVFSCRINGISRPRVRWFKDRKEVKKSNNIFIYDDGYLEIHPVQFTDFGTYMCEASNADRSRTSRVVSLRQNPKTDEITKGVAPYFIERPKNTKAVVGSTVVLHCGANGHDSQGKRPGIQWLKDGSRIQFKSSKNARIQTVGSLSLRIMMLTKADAGVYTCRAVNLEDSVDSDASLTVLVPPKFEKRPANVFAHTNSDVMFECDVSGHPPPIISWFKNGDVVIPSDYFQITDGKNLKILGLVNSDEGIYQCFGSNELGNVQASAQLVILQPDIPLPTTPSLYPLVHPGAMFTDSKNLPSMPNNLRAVLVSTRFVTLSWQTPDHTGPSGIIAYSVFWRERDSERERVTNTTTTEANIQHLKSDTEYVFHVRAYNRFGPSTKDATLTVTTDQEVHVPSPPVNLRAVPVSPTAIKVTWDAPQHKKGYITHYVLIYYEVGSTNEDEITVQGTGFTLQNLKIFREYSFRVVAHNQNGPGMSTEEFVAQTFSSTPSATPQNFTLEVSSATRIIVRWEPPPLDKQNGIITGYKIRYKKSGTKQGKTVTTDGNRNNYALTDLRKGTEYQVRISALTVNGSGITTPWQSASTYRDNLYEHNVPPAPARLQVKPKANSIVVNWAPPPTDAKILVRGYVLGYGRGIPDVYQTTLDANTHDYTIQNLQPASEYVISIRAFNNAGQGRVKLETVTTSEETTEEPATPMMPPIGLKAIVLSPSTIVLTWADNSLGKSQKINDNRYYTVRYTPLPTNRGRARFVNSTDLNAHVDGLKPNTQYEFVVMVIKGRRESTWSMSVINTTQESAPGSEPRDLTPVPMEKNPLAVTLNWQPPQRPNGLITGYLIFYTTDSKQEDRDWVVEGVVGDHLSTVISDLTPDTTYFFKVQARNRKGYGPMSKTVIYKTPKVTKSASTESSAPGGLSMNVIIIIAAVGVGVTFLIVIVAVIAIILVCRRRDAQRQAALSYKSPNKPVKGIQKDVKPPDLWIHQPNNLELDKMSKSHRSESNMSVATSTMRRSSQGSSDRLDDLPPGMDALDKRRNSFVGESGYPSSGEERYQAPQHRSIIRPKPITIPVDAQPVHREPVATVTALPNGHIMQMIDPRDGLPMRPVYPRTQYNTQYTSTPRVNAGDIPQSSSTKRLHSSDDDEGNCSYGHDVMEDSYTSRIGYVKPQQNLSPYKKPTPPVSSGPIKPRTAVPVVTSKAPDVTLKSGKEDPGLEVKNKSLSTEELTAEMANLEGLMKDLNAITQQEFEC